MNQFFTLNNSVCLFGLYVILTFVGYLTPNPFLYKLTLLFQINSILYKYSFLFTHS